MSVMWRIAYRGPDIHNAESFAISPTYSPPNWQLTAGVTCDTHAQQTLLLDTSWRPHQGELTRITEHHKAINRWIAAIEQIVQEAKTVDRSKFAEWIAGREKWASRQKELWELQKANEREKASASALKGAAIGQPLLKWERGLGAIGELLQIHKRYLRSSGDPAIVAALCSRIGDLGDNLVDLTTEFEQRDAYAEKLEEQLAEKDKELKKALARLEKKPRQKRLKPPALAA